MSDFFADVKYDNMDWISQAVEPIESDLEARWALIPDEMEISPDDLYIDSSGYINLGNAARHQILKCDPMFNIGLFWPFGYDELFQTEINTEIEWDVINKKFSSPLILRKKKRALTQQDLMRIMVYRVSDKIRNISINSDDEVLRAREVLDLIDHSRLVAAGRSKYKLAREINDATQAKITANEWRVRNTDLALKIGEWICEYIQRGNLHAMANFAKFKVMTHNGAPIYSVKEVV